MKLVQTRTGVCGLLLVCLAGAAMAKGPAYTDPQAAGEDYARQGEYVGEVTVDGEPTKVGVQVIALGEGQFEAVAYLGGLPGAGWEGSERPESVTSQVQDGKIVFLSDTAKGILGDGEITILSPDNQRLGAVKKVDRSSPTLGQKPPEGAVVLFDGTSVEHWQGGKMTDEGYLMQGTTSTDKFQSHKLHIEFRLPFQPEDRGQARGNSGVYLQGRYEVQMLDSFGQPGRDNEAGGIYEISSPLVNMCLPPLVWQTYDIEFTAAKYNDSDNSVVNPRITVYHNGVLVQRDVELPRGTRAAPIQPGPDPGPIYLQDHGNPVRYRNIWVVPTDQ